MTIMGKLVLAFSIAWILWQALSTWRRVRSGGIVVPPLVAATFVFALSVILILISGASPFHLLWLFPLSFVAGIVLLFFPFGSKLILGLLEVLAKAQGSHER